MASYKILAWRGIPTCVKARDEDGNRVSRAFPDWFGQEVDRQAMRDGIIASDAYLEAYEWSLEADRAGSAADVAEAIINELSKAWREEDRPVT
jgi:hypothetical protein